MEREKKVHDTVAHDKPSCCPISHFERLPSLVVFDLDDTLWRGDIDCTYGPPYTFHQDKVQDKRRHSFALCNDVIKIMHSLFTAKVKIAYASRTWSPEWATRALETIHIDSNGNSLLSICSSRAWGDISKDNHLRKIRSELEIPYHEMLFFDNEERNVPPVAKLGVHAHHCPSGMNWEIFIQALFHFQSKK